MGGGDAYSLHLKTYCNFSSVQFEFFLYRKLQATIKLISPNNVEKLNRVPVIKCLNNFTVHGNQITLKNLLN